SLIKSSAFARRAAIQNCGVNAGALRYGFQFNRGFAAGCNSSIVNARGAMRKHLMLLVAAWSLWTLGAGDQRLFTNEILAATHSAAVIHQAGGNSQSVSGSRLGIKLPLL